MNVSPRNDTLVVRGDPRCGHRSARSDRGRKLAAVGRRKAPRRSCRSRARSGLRSVRRRRLERAVDPPSTRSSRSEDRCTSAVDSGMAGRPRRTGRARGGHEVPRPLRRLAPDDIAADALLAGLRHGAALTSTRKGDARSWDKVWEEAREARIEFERLARIDTAAPSAAAGPRRRSGPAPRGGLPRLFHWKRSGSRTLLTERDVDSHLQSTDERQMTRTTGQAR